MFYRADPKGTAKTIQLLYDIVCFLCSVFPVSGITKYFIITEISSLSSLTFKKVGEMSLGCLE